MGLYRRGKVWWLRYTVAGKHYRVSTKQTVKRDAKEAAARIESATLDGRFDPTRKPTEAPVFEDACEAYMERNRAHGRKPDSYRALWGYTDSKGDRSSEGAWLQAFRGRPLDSISPDEIDALLRRWQRESNWSNSTRNNRLLQLSGLFRYAYRTRRWVEQNPCERVERLPVDNGRERWLRRAELDRLCRKAEAMGYGWLPPIIRTAAATGMRRGEVCGLRVADMERDDEGRAYLTVRKTKNGEALVWPLEGATLKLVEQQRRKAWRPEALLFPGPGGGSAYTAIGRYLRPVAEAAKLEWGCTRDGFTFHSLRHTMASQALNRGASTKQVQGAGNWKTSAMVDRYAKLSGESLRETAALLADLAEAGSH